MGFALTAAIRYKKETRVESSFLTGPARSRFYPEIRIARLPKRTPERLTLLVMAFNRRSMQNPRANRQLIFEKCTDFVCQGATVTLFAPH